MSNYHHINIRSSSTRKAPALSSNQRVDAKYGENPQNGDVVIGKILELGQHTKFEEPGGHEIILQRGNVVSVVLGRRYSTKEFCGMIPDMLTQNCKFDLLNVGGIAGSVVSRNTLAKGPTRLLYLGHAVDDNNKIINTLNFQSAKKTKHPKTIDWPLKIIMVCGSEMDSGKTLSSGQIINILSNNGFVVGGGKLTGTSRMKDILYMKASGARCILDFMDVGYPSTYLCSIDELKDIFYAFTEYFADQGCKFLVVEVADGIFQRETEMILNCSDIMENISFFTLAANNSVSAYGGIIYLKNQYGITPDFISGLITADWLSMEELHTKIPVHFLKNSSESRKDFLQIIQQKVL